MNEGLSSPSPAGGDPPGFWPRCRATVGPTLVGLVGGGLTAGVAVVAISTLLHNCAATYAKFPGVERPWLAQDFTVPDYLIVPLALLGFAGPFAMGLATALLVRSRDGWGDLAAGLQTCLAGTLAGYAAGVGLATTLALVVVPSIADFQAFADATKTPDATRPGRQRSRRTSWRSATPTSRRCRRTSAAPRSTRR
jgi:hypothetical protein